MSKHICVYFDDGDLDPGCVCGERVVLLVDEDGVEVLAILDAGVDGARVHDLARPVEAHRVLAASA